VKIDIQTGSLTTTDAHIKKTRNGQTHDISCAENHNYM